MGQPKRLRDIWDALQGEVWFAECKTNVAPLGNDIEWDVYQCEIMRGGDPIGAAYGENADEARDRAEVFVRALGFEVPGRVSKEVAT